MTLLVHGEVYRRYEHGPGLGRNLWLDARSLAYMVERDAGAMSTALKDRSWQRKIPIMDQGELGSCFPPGTRIRLADGSETAIEDVRLLDEVVTAEGRTGRVIQSMVRDEASGLVRILLWGHAHLRLTREHPVLTSRGYVPAGELGVGDEVALPRYFGSGVTAIPVADFITNPSHRLVRGNRWSGPPGRKGLKTDANLLPEKIDLSPGVGRLLGLFLAEGSCDPSKARWTFGAKEKETLVANTVQLLASEWGVTAHVAERANNSINVTVYGTAWARLLHALCGNGAGMKRPHPLLMGGSAEFQEAVLDGWLDGDGTIRQDGSRSGVSISGDLVLAMYDIAQALGRHPVMDWRESPQNAYAKVRQPRWTLTMAPGSGRCSQDETHVWRRVRELRVEEYVGPVYNLSVEGDESYVAEGVGVHNCTANAGAGALGTQPYWDKVGHRVVANDARRAEAYAVELYAAATVADGYPGVYPPEDTGSSGLAVCKVLRTRRTISGYRWASSAYGLLRLLQDGPVLMGMPWWQAFSETNGAGFIDSGRWRSSSLEGGHEVEIIGCEINQRDVGNSVLTCCNSWSTSWGDSGFFRLRLKTYTALDEVDLKQFVV